MKMHLCILCIVIMQRLSTQTIATTDYIFPYSAAIQKDNFYGVQFHTEKSAEAGEKIFKFFKY